VSELFPHYAEFLAKTLDGAEPPAFAGELDEEFWERVEDGSVITPDDEIFADDHGDRGQPMPPVRGTALTSGSKKPAPRTVVHEVEMHVPGIDLSGRDVIFTARVRGRKLGELHVSQGDLTWRPSGTSRKEYKVSWATFDKWMKEDGTVEQTASKRAPRTS
jgi:hypothetical protein